MDKKTFVETVFAEAIKIACDWIETVQYQEIIKTGAEKVRLTCKNGYVYSVDVSCDSLAAIISDVSRELLRH